MNKKISLEKKIINSKFSFTKHALYYMIVPALILIVGIILNFTVGFNLGTDWTGSSSVKVFVNYEETLVDANSYNLNDSKDFSTVFGKVKTVFEENNLKIVSYRTSTMKYDIVNGQAVEVVFQNNSTKEADINNENEELRQALIAEFEYANYENAVSTVDFAPAQYSFNWAIGLLAGIVFGLISTIIYMMFRYDKSAWVVLVLQTALDFLLTMSLICIFRLTINLTIGIAILSTFIMTILNTFVYYAKMKENIKSGKFAGMKNDQMANTTVKETLFKKTVLFAILLLLTFVIAIISVEGIREVALALSVALITTYFTSTFFTPAVWKVVYKESKKKPTQKQTKNA